MELEVSFVHKVEQFKSSNLFTIKYTLPNLGDSFHQRVFEIASLYSIASPSPLLSSAPGTLFEGEPGKITLERSSNSSFPSLLPPLFPIAVVVLPPLRSTRERKRELPLLMASLIDCTEEREEEGEGEEAENGFLFYFSTLLL